MRERAIAIIAVIAALACAGGIVRPSSRDMGLPATRPRTYGSSTPIVPQDLDDIFDQIIALRTRDVKINAAGALLLGGAAIGGSPGIVQLTGGGQGIEMAIPVEVGQRLTGVSLRVVPQTSGGVDFSLYEIEDGVGATQIGATQSSSGTASQTLSIATSKDIVAVQHKSYVVQAVRTAGAANLLYYVGFTTAPTP